TRRGTDGAGGRFPFEQHQDSLAYALHERNLGSVQRKSRRSQDFPWRVICPVSLRDRSRAAGVEIVVRDNAGLRRRSPQTGIENYKVRGGRAGTAGGGRLERVLGGVIVH